MTVEDFMTGSIELFEEHNRKYDAGCFRGSEANKYNLDAIKFWISIRDNYKLVTDANTPGNWKRLNIIIGWRSKYGINNIYIDETQHLCRFKETSDEFYGKDMPEVSY